MTTILDLLLLLGLTLRLMRLLSIDALTVNLRAAVDRWAGPRDPAHPELADPVLLWRRQWWADALTCFFCSGFWIGVLTTLSLILAGGAGQAATIWRYGAGVFALNYLAGHIASRADTDDSGAD